jgi:hypothetical protein
VQPEFLVSIGEVVHAAMMPEVPWDLALAF